MKSYSFKVCYSFYETASFKGLEFKFAEKAIKVFWMSWPQYEKKFYRDKLLYYSKFILILNVSIFPIFIYFSDRCIIKHNVCE